MAERPGTEAERQLAVLQDEDQTAECARIQIWPYVHADQDIKRQIRSYFRQKCNVTAKFAASLLSRLGGLRHCNSRNIYREYMPKGIQKKLKDVVREYQRKELIEWSTFLEDQRVIVMSA